MRISDWSSDVCSSDLKRSLAAVRIDLLHDLSSVMCRDRHDLGLAVALDQSKHGHLAGSAPAAFAFPGPAKRRFIKFQHTLERRLQLLRHSAARSEEHTSELQPLMRISYAVFSLKK